MELKSVQDVIEALGAIVDDALVARDRRGLFAALYRRTTRGVLVAIEQGRFENPERMEELDIRFAQRYFDAWNRFEADGTAPRTWAYAFERAREDAPHVLQHLLLGMNAHIAFDLAMSVVDTIGGSDLAPLERDFFEVNRVLAAMVDEVQEELHRTSPWLARLDHVGGRLDEHLAATFLARARSAAWRKAQRLATLSASDRIAEIGRWERQVEGVARRICPPDGHRWGRVRGRRVGAFGTDRAHLPALLATLA